MIPMEILVVALSLVSFFLFSLMTYIIGVTLLSFGLTLIILGLLFGIPSGLYYHLLLFHRRRLINLGLEKWWIFPQRYHKYLPDKDKSVLERWFWVGAIFFYLSVVGSALVFISLLMGNWQPPI